MTRIEAIELLGKYAYNLKNNNIIESRIDRLIKFANDNNSKIDIHINNNWKTPNKKNKKCVLLGGTTYKYMVWAIIK